MTLTSAVAVLKGMPDASVFQNIFDQNDRALSAKALDLMASLAGQAKTVFSVVGVDPRYADLVLVVGGAASAETSEGQDADLMEGLWEDAALAYNHLASECHGLAPRLEFALKA